MVDHDFVKDFLNQKELIEKLSPKFNEMTLDVQEIFKHSRNPLFVAVLLFKLAEERNKTNKILEQINDKYDKLMFEFKTKEMRNTEKEPAREVYEILSEVDQKILNLVEKNGSISAQQVQEEIGYKGRNAASQRLNQLFKLGHLKKVHAGKKTLYLLKN